MRGGASGHVSSDLLGEAAQHASLDSLRPDERRHVESCDRCKQLYAGYRLTDRLLAADWRQTTVPAAALETPDDRPIRTRVAGVLEGFVAGLDSRSFVPVALAACLVLIVGVAVLLPALTPQPAPAASASQEPSSEPSPAVSASPATPSSSPVAIADGSPIPGDTSGTGPAGPPAATAASSVAATPVPEPPTAVTLLSGWPVVWAPDGAHFMVTRGTGWTRSRTIQICNAAGGITGSFNADNATWVDSDTIAATTHSSVSGHGPGSGPGFTGSVATISLLDLRGRVAGTLPGQFLPGGTSLGGATLLGSGTGYLAVSVQGTWGGSTSSFVLWDGARLSSAHDGVPIAFSRDGRKIAVMHPSGANGGTSGWLEIVSSAGLRSSASFTHTTVRVAAAGDGPGYAPDATFSPNGQSMLVSGTLVDLSRGSAQQVGDGGWRPDGTLVTSGSGGTVLFWQGGHAAADPRFAAGGSIAVSLHGDVVEYFGDGRPPLLLTSDGTLGQLNLNGVASIDGMSLAPDGGAAAVSGRASDGSRVIAVTVLP